MVNSNNMAKSKNKKSPKKKSKDSLKLLNEKVLSLETELEKQTEETQRISEKNIRLLAEFDNYKRRTQEERNNILLYDGKELAKALLPIIDDLYRTLESNGKSKTKTILDGIKLILSNLAKILEEQGIVSFDSLGDDFNPDYHEALLSELSEKKENIILKEIEKGYMYNEKILRHAKVVVSKK